MNTPNEQKTYPIFTEEMKKDYTILVPTMLPVHIKLLTKIMKSYGYNAVMLEPSLDRKIPDTGIKYVHNDICYPALLVIGQFLVALESGEYDPNKVALLITQTGGGCRASNYIHLLRKALEKAGYGHVPVISFNVSGLEKDSGFQITFPILHRMMYAVLYGDLLMCLKNQCLPYENNKGDTEALVEYWTNRLAEDMETKRVSYRRIKSIYTEIVKSFAAIPMTKTEKVKVGIVGEIFVKYSPLGNNNLEHFLLGENAECMVPGLTDFCLYTIYDSIMDYKLYRRNKKSVWIYRIVYRMFINKQLDLIKAITENSDFAPMSSFKHAPDLTENLIGNGMKMGEGWLLTAEMVELYKMGVKNIVCTQPFGCLPNHIAGKGMMKPLKEAYPDINIVAVDYDPGATQINQENRIKLMLENARDSLRLEKEGSPSDAKASQRELTPV
ncbi:MAG: 2-hydroxyglutaryl-CoA dehydratase [Ruminococcaceae bacterium]|nr:2-hydroxyglutaryl-CoA dehydratase [Oscillospiraceae bacterium]